VLGRTFRKLNLSEGRTFFYLKTPSKVSGTLINTPKATAATRKGEKKSRDTFKVFLKQHAKN